MDSGTERANTRSTGAKYNRRGEKERMEAAIKDALTFRPKKGATAALGHYQSVFKSVDDETILVSYLGSLLVA